VSTDKVRPSVIAIALLLSAGAVSAQALQTPAAHPKCEGAEVPSLDRPAPADPYPLMAAGWGPEFGHGLMASRWAEDWSGMRAAGRAPAFKAMPLSDNATLTLSAEVRVRNDTFANAQLSSGNDDERTLFRGVLGADLRIGRTVRAYGEIATGRVQGGHATASANFENHAALQQLFVDVHGHAGTALVGAMIGRQEFADGPRQLISLSDGPNMHRTWNGTRFYAHWKRLRVGVFDLRATALSPGSFDETVNPGERLRGVDASLIVTPGEGPNTYLEPFWFRTSKPNIAVGDHIGTDERDTAGVRVWGRRGRLRFDWTFARQGGESVARNVDAWGLFAVQSLELSGNGWKPRLTSHIDIASGGDAGSAGTVETFNPLYASSNYLGEGQFLSLSNLVLVAPGINLSPTARTTLSFEYGFARRFAERDAVYAGGVRAYTGTQDVPGREIGGLLRVSGTWAASTRLTVFFNFERLDAGDVLRRAGFVSGSYTAVGATYRY
jgi:hypothetical protein